MPRKIDSIIQQFLNEITKLLGSRMKKVILFGSYARGDYDENSDLDIMILTDFSDEELIEYRTKVREIACDIELDNDIMISPILRNINKYQERVEVIPFYMNVNKEGVILRG